MIGSGNGNPKFLVVVSAWVAAMAVALLLDETVATWAYWHQADRHHQRANDEHDQAEQHRRKHLTELGFGERRMLLEQKAQVPHKLSKKLAK